MPRDLIKLVSTAVNPKTGRATAHSYTFDKNKKLQPGKLELKKFDPVVKKHVIYKEAKIK